MADQYLQTLDPRYQAEYEDAQRRQQMAQAMMQMSMKGPMAPQQAGGITPRMHPLQAALSAMQGIMAARGMEGAQKSMSDVLSRNSNDAAQQIGQFQQIAGREARPEETRAGPIGSRDDASMAETNTIPGQTGGFNQAIAQFQTSQNPRVQAFIANQQKMQQERLFKIADAAKEQAPGYAVDALRTNNIPTAGMPDPKMPVFGTTPGPDGKPLNTVTNFKGPNATASFAPAGTNVSVSNGPGKAGLTELFKAGTDKVVKNADKAEAALALNSTLDQLQSYSKDGIITGPATDGLTWIAGLAKSAGLPVDSKKLADTQSYNSLAQEAVQNMISQMPRGNAGITAPEAERIAKIMPLASHSPEARAEITSILKQASDRHVAVFRQSLQGLTDAISSQDPTKANFGDIFLPPAASQGFTKPQVPGAAPPISQAPASGSPIPTFNEINTAATSDAKNGPTEYNLNGQQGRVDPMTGIPPSVARKQVFVEPPGWKNLTPAQQKRYKELKGIQ